MYRVAPKKCIHSLLINIFGISYDSVWMPMVAIRTPTLNPKFKDISHINFAFV